MLNAMSDNKKRRIVFTVLVYIFMPAIFVAAGAFIYSINEIDGDTRSRFKENMEIMARKYKKNTDVNIKDLLSIVQFTSDLHSLGELRSPENLASVFSKMDRDFDHVFEDIGILGEDGKHLAYVGPHDLLEMDYSKEEWFLDVMENGVTVSDVFLGYRRSPHFIIAIKKEDGKQTWIMRVTVNVFLFSSLLDNIRLGRTGEVFIVNSEGVLQTRSLTHGAILQKVDDALLHSISAGVEGSFKRERQGVVFDYTIARLTSKSDWWLVVQREERELNQALRTRTANYALLFGVCVLLLAGAAVLGLRLLLAQVEKIDMEKTLLNDQVIQSQKLAAIGQLSAGIAHEINNPLAIIGEEAGWLQDLLKRETMARFAEIDEFHDSLREIVTQAGRCREITHKLLSFARKMDSTIRDVDMHTLVSEVVGMREREATLNNISIVKEFASDLPIIHSEPSLLRQVLLNLLNNAIDAIHGGGRITISVSKLSEGGITVSISDTGIGIPKENLDKIFDPFFTTKEPGRGTGLGLSICHGIIQKLGGEISVHSQPGEGTTFIINLPQEAPADIR